MFKVKQLRPTAIMPKRATPFSAGLDFFTPIDFIMAPGSRILIATGFAVEIPTNCYGRLASTSRLSWEFGIEVGAGVIDSDYRGEVKVLLYNHGDTSVTLHRGDKIAQLIVSPIIISCAVVTDAALSSTIRGTRGFGEMN